MAVEIRHFTATFPAGTPASAPITISTQFPVRVVTSIDWRIPPGPQGAMGWQIAMGGVQVVPYGPDLWVIDDSNSGTFSLDDAPDSGAWEVIGYNTGSSPHSVYLTFHLNLVQRKQPRPGVIDARLLAPVPDLSRAGAPIRGMS